VASREAPLGIAENPANRDGVETISAWSDREDLCAVRPIGQLLTEAGLISDSDLARGIAFQKHYGGRLGNVLVRLGALSEERLLPILSAQLDIPVLGENDLPGDTAAFLDAIKQSGYPVDWWVDQEALPWMAKDGLRVIAKDPLMTDLQEFVCAGYGTIPIHWALTPSQVLDRAMERVQQQGVLDGRNISDEVSHLRELAEEAPVIELVNNLIGQAFEEQASDIHVEPAERDFRVRFRLDGVLQTRLTLARDRFDAVASRIKIVSGLDIAERRLPQDGRLSVRLSGEMVDIRVSSLPSTWGESLVLRLLPKERQQYRLDRLGMTADDLKGFGHWIREPHGIILITGPTGSGKSTTLYATLEEINDGSTKIVTVEDPVEYSVKGISQVQTQPEIGYTFARALRSILRQDPDKIMVGEIRDLETAQIAVQAALTGHMVFSTLHTNDALSAFTRLIDMASNLSSLPPPSGWSSRNGWRAGYAFVAHSRNTLPAKSSGRSSNCDSGCRSSSRVQHAGGARSDVGNAITRGSRVAWVFTRWSASAPIFTTPSYGAPQRRKWARWPVGKVHELLGRMASPKRGERKRASRKCSV
jgi:general secretion pathway protein E